MVTASPRPALAPKTYAGVFLPTVAKQLLGFPCVIPGALPYSTKQPEAGVIMEK